MTIVHHGSSKLFDIFDYGKIGLNGTCEGYGFYFTTDKRIAEGYGQEGYLYTVKFNGKKTLSAANKTITKSQLKKFLSRLDKNGDYLSNYGDIAYEGYNQVLQTAIDNEWETNENDVDLVSGICNAYGSYEVVLTELYHMFGYDHIQVTADWGNASGAGNELYIALVNEAFIISSVEQLYLH